MIIRLAQIGDSAALAGIYGQDFCRHTGYKCHRWHDVAWFEKEINSYSSEPSPFIPLAQLDPEPIREILRRDNVCLSQEKRHPF